MATATTEKSTSIYSFNPAEVMIDTWLRSINTMCLAQEQGEKMLSTWMDYNKTAREESLKAATRFAELAKENQRHMQNVFATTAKLAVEAYRMPQVKAFEEYNTRIDELAKQVQKLHN